MKYNAVLFDYGGTLGSPAFKEGQYPGSPSEWVPVMLKSLFDAGYRLGVVSNSNRYGDARWLRHRLGKKDWMQYLEVVMGSGGTLGTNGGGLHKPDPEIYKRATDFLNVPVWKTLFVGDTFDADVAMPCSLGMGGLLVDVADGYSTELWEALEDEPCLRPNVLTQYVIENDTLTTRLKHLTEPLVKYHEIIAGLEEYTVIEWDLEHDKDDILKNDKRLIRMKIDPGGK